MVATRKTGAKSKMTLAPHQIILRPLVTEKGMHRATRNNQYAFEVNPLATKSDIKTAVEQLFDVDVEKVRTQNRKGKPRRYRFRFGRTKAWKKAIVTLSDEDRIDFF
ncbi:MAG: 50S ribosomal protein L23 [Planctomycetaceae bacterium]|nr:50S ribosomal protein L23 [Planctomycetaceae bacterium]